MRQFHWVVTLFPLKKGHKLWVCPIFRHKSYVWLCIPCDHTPYYLYIPFDPLKLSNHLAKVTGLVTAGISDHVGRRPVMVTCFQAVRPQKLILILWFPDVLFPCLTVCHKNHKKRGLILGHFSVCHLAVCQNLVPLVNIKNSW